MGQKDRNLYFAFGDLISDDVLKCCNISHTPPVLGAMMKNDLNSYWATFVNNHGGPWDKNPKWLMKTSNVLIISLQKASWHHREGIWLKQWKEKVRIWIQKRLPKYTSKKMQKVHSKCTFFDEEAYLRQCKYFYCFISLPDNDAQKNGLKRRFLEWVLVFFTCKKWPKKMTIKLTFDPQKGLETSEQSTRNVALCEISMGWERKEQKNTCIISSRVASTYLCPSWWIVFCHSMSDCCRLLQTAFGYCVDALSFAV